MTGKFIVLEGIDGAGTTTQMARVSDYLKGKRIKVHTTREPTTGPIGKLIRQMLTGEIANASRDRGEMMALLFAADRIDHNISEIEPALEAGAWVISDRYDLSSLTYQSAASVDLTDDERVTWIRSLNRHARRPDLTLIVHVDASVAKERRRTRGQSEELYERDALQVRLADAYRDAESLVPGDRIVHIDGNRTMDEVTAALIAGLEDEFGNHDESSDPVRLT
jgi:dTMP kinase